MITQRQQNILNAVIDEYIRLAEPISSQFLEQEYDFGIRGAMIRREMQELTEAGYLEQPHTSAGRVPTDKGYRFLVDNILEQGSSDEVIDFNLEDIIKENAKDTFIIINSLTKTLADACSGFVLSYLEDEDILWKEGWKKILQEPEFKDPDVLPSFMQTLEHFENGLKNFNVDSDLKIYIGKEHRFDDAEYFSTIVTRCYFPEESTIAILGLKRMAYQRNIALINSLTNYGRNKKRNKKRGKK